jgi:ADP-ribosylation factor-like protein 6
MGIFKRLFGSKSGKKASICVVGLDNSGKTTFLNALKPKSASLETVPTVGFSTEEFKKNGVNFTAFDMSGQSRYRNLWEHYYGDVQGIIVVVDASDPLRFVVAKDELDMMLDDKNVRGGTVPILFLANKIDLPNSASVDEISQALCLNQLSGRPCHIAATDALKGDGVEDALKWLASVMKSIEKQG